MQNKTDLPIFQKGADAHPEGPENEPCTEIIIIPQTVQNSGLFSLATGLNYKYHWNVIDHYKIYLKPVTFF